VSYPTLALVTCAVLAFHTVCEIIRVSYPNVDMLVTNRKQVFVKSYARIELFQNKAPGIPFALIPVIMLVRSGT
jgi:hypothetical protein